MANPRAAAHLAADDHADVLLRLGLVDQSVRGVIHPGRQHREHDLPKRPSRSSWAPSGTSSSGSASTPPCSGSRRPTRAPTEPGSVSQTLDGRQRSGLRGRGVGRILPRWKIFAGYTYPQHAGRSSPGTSRPASRSRARTCRASPEQLEPVDDLRHHGPAGRSAAGPSTSSKRCANTTNPNDVARLRHAATLTVGVPALVKNVELRMNVLNISDERYFEQVYPGPRRPGRRPDVPVHGHLRF